MKYKIYTDGACSGNPGPGGWAAIILVDDKIKEEKTLTNRFDIDENCLKIGMGLMAYLAIKS